MAAFREPVSHAVDLRGASSSFADASSGDIRGYWRTFFRFDYAWRWGAKPHLHFPAGQEYTQTDEYIAIDGMGREFRDRRPFECTIDPTTGKFQTLYVQATDSICKLSNATWKRTVVRNVAPKFLRCANIPFQMIPTERVDSSSKYTGTDWLTVVVLWIPAVIYLFFAMFMWDADRPKGKEATSYLPLLYNGFRYPRLARNYLENKQSVARQGRYDPSWSSTAIGAYRTLRPRLLCYLVEKEVIDRNGNKRIVQTYRPMFVPVDDNTPYVFISYTRQHFDITPGSKDLGMLDALAFKATALYADSIQDPAKKPRAFWLAHCCTPNNRYLDVDGRERIIDEYTPNGQSQRDRLADEDVYSISDVIRAAEHVIVIAGNPWRDSTTDALKSWGKRVWTFPEILLSKGDSVSVFSCGQRPPKFESISKSRFPTLGWGDPVQSRQLLEHFTNLHLTRLELVKVALECLLSRTLKVKHPGDRSYALMGLLRIRPPIDRNDSSFQAFARLSLPQDSDRLMERLICLLPDTPNESWELMTDQYKSSLWDIYPDTQVCGVGENDTVIVDGCKGALIQWSMFSTVQTLKQLTTKRKFFLKLVQFSYLIFFVACVLAYFIPSLGGPFIAISILCFQLPAPYYIWSIFGGKLWAVEPCLFGIEGYVPLGVIEEKLFGTRLNRMSWSPYGSPLSRHEPGMSCRERTLCYPDADDDVASTVPLVETIDTYPVNAIDPCSRCAECMTRPEVPCKNHETVASAWRKSHSAMGDTKIFTLIDTHSMTATLFHAARPPMALIIGGSEGGMKRALACSYDITTGTMYRETVLRVPSQTVDKMHALPRIRLGLKRPFLSSFVKSKGATHRAPNDQLAGRGGAPEPQWEQIAMQPIKSSVV